MDREHHCANVPGHLQILLQDVLQLRGDQIKRATMSVYSRRLRLAHFLFDHIKLI